MKVMERHGKATCFRKIKCRNVRNLKKTTKESETGFNFSRNKDKHKLCIVILENMLLNYCFDTTVRTNA